jgi:para-aminobenzoate synthetase component 1
VWSLFALNGKQNIPIEEREFLYCFRPYSATLYYKNHALNLLTGEKIHRPITTFLETLSAVNLQASFAKPKVIHFYFELGYLLHNLETSVADHLPLAIEINYLKARKIKAQEFFADRENLSPKMTLLQSPTWQEYQKDFKKIFGHLMAGDCYQLNYTSGFYFTWNKKYQAKDFLFKLWFAQGAAPFGHATWLGKWNKLILSQSPECLFQRRFRVDGRPYLLSMPIKGTLAQKNTTQSTQKLWKTLSNQKKNEVELNIITDLVRNDLARIYWPNVKVEALKKPLRVPGLIHQYSELSVPVSFKTDWLKILKALFPGGSISGAPKKRVLELIFAIESEPRGLYTGSTWLAYGNILTANINIRTADIDLNLHELKYGAGGGITLKSEAAQEYREMLDKMHSVLKPFL